MSAPLINLQIELFWGSSRAEAEGRAKEYCTKFPRWHLYPNVNVRRTKDGSQYVKVAYSVVA